MKERCLAPAPDGSLVDVPAEEAYELVAAGNRTVWIDLEAFGADELNERLQRLRLSPGTIRACTGVPGRTRVGVYDGELFFELPALASDVGSDRVALAFVSAPSLCLTLHHKPVEGLRRTAETLREGGGLKGATPPALVAALLEGLGQRAVEAVHGIRARVLQMQNQMDREPHEVELDEILHYGTTLRTLDAVISERIACFDRLQLLDPSVLDLSARREFLEALADTQYLERVIDRLEKRLETLRDQYSMSQQDRTNQRLAVLTVVSAIFLPMTLIAGVYGMNFQVMPELTAPYGYPLVIGAMLVVGLGMLWYFRSRGWFE